MDFTKFVAMLATSAIYFPRADMLGDSWEGSYSAANLEPDLDILAKFPPGFFDRFDNPQFEAERMLKMNRSGVRVLRQLVYISCWHINEHESAGMWKLYAEEKNAIAVQSTYSLLKKNLKGLPIGKVNYIDYQNTRIPELDGFLAPFLYKRKSFEHEREIRAIFFANKGEEDGIDDVGLYFEITLSAVIKSIYLSPTSPPWFLDVVKDVVTKYGLDPNIVIQSDLLKDPIW